MKDDNLSILTVYIIAAAFVYALFMLFASAARADHNPSIPPDHLAVAGVCDDYAELVEALTSLESDPNRKIEGCFRFAPIMLPLTYSS